MITVSKSFTATGNGDALFVRNNESFTYSVSGTFVGTVVLEKSNNGGLTWTPITSATGAASGTVVVENTDGSAVVVRFRCSAFTSGTIVTSLVEVSETVQRFLNRAGDSVLTLTETGVSVPGTLDVTGVLTASGGISRTSQKRIISAAGAAKVGATSGWVVAGANDTALVTCPASQTGSTLVVPITGLKVGDTITSFHLVGQVESAGNTATVDADLRKMTAAAADVSDASVGAITQLSVTADAIMSSSNTEKASLTEVVAADETFYVLITATTAASTDIALQGVAVTVTEA